VTTPASVRVLEMQMLLLKRIWKTNLTLSFLQPLLFFLGMGLGVGSLVDDRASSSEALGDISYATFLGPGLLATTAMLTAAGESLWPVLGGFKWEGSYEAMAATRLTAPQVVRGQFLWLAVRMGIAVGGVAVVLAVHPDTRSWGILPAVPAALLCGLVFTAWITAWAASREYDTSFSNVQRLVITPLFLFGGAFYPVDSLPDALRPVAWVTPLWHGVELCRGFVLHTLGMTEALGHVAVLVIWLIPGWIVCDRLFAKRLYR
jgi:lipooligosaccharide transport system permease protein